MGVREGICEPPGHPGLNSGTGADTRGHSGGAGSGESFWGAGTGGHIRGAGSGGCLRGAGTGALHGLNSGTGALSPLLWHSPRTILSSPSAAMQAFSLKAGVVAGSRTLTTSSAAPARWRSVVLSLCVAMARRSRWALALHQRWAQACAPSSGEMVGWALGREWNSRDSLLHMQHSG